MPISGPNNDGLSLDVIETRLGRRRQFARQYVSSNFNGAKAARAVGVSEASARTQACKWLREPEVLAMVKEETDERADRLRVTEERIIDAYAALAFGDSRRVVTWDDTGSGSIADSGQLTEEEAMRVQSVERNERFDREGNPIVTVKVTLAPRQPALDALAKIKGLLRDKVDIDVTGGVADEMAELRAKRRERVAASDAARPIDVEVIENEPRAQTDMGIPMSAPPAPGIAQRFAARTPREEE